MSARVRTWMARDPDPDTREELQQLIDAGNDDELERRFARRLEFGTAGLRGILGAGPSRMNRLVVRETTAGLGAYLLAELPRVGQRGVVVGFDGRRGSRVFAEDAAAVLAGLGIVAHLSDREVATPVCAFAVRELECAAGIVITASHNPPEYNGYKVYWENGAQIIEPHDRGIAEAIERAAREKIPWMDPVKGRSEGLIRALGDKTVDAYLDGVEALSCRPDPAGRADLVIAYTPLHGVGAETAERALARSGFEHVHTVAEQREPDGRFPTVRFPNPEEPGAMDAVLALARDNEAQLACANDPDADRLAVAVRTPEGDYRMLTGNQIGVLLGSEAILHHQGDVAVGTTIVSSRMLQVVANASGAGYYETLTGFKWIANAGIDQEARGRRVIFGYEEALGYCVGTLVRDKDGISALVAFCEMAAGYAAEGRTVLDELERLYREHGLFVTTQETIAVDPEASGPTIGDRLRATVPSQIAGRAIVRVTDVAAGHIIEPDGRARTIALPTSDVLIYDLADESRVIVRPSGTEPKLKCYYEVRYSMAADEGFSAAETRAASTLEQLVRQHQAELAALSA